MPFLPIAKKDPGGPGRPGVKRLRMDCQATVTIGAFSRGGQTHGEYKASDHDFGSTEHYRPCGILDEDTAPLSVPCGSSATPSDFIVATRMAWWQGLSVQAQGAIEQLQLTRDTGPESSGVRTHFLHRMVPLVASIGKPLQLLSYPPSPSKSNPSERCWGIRELQWKGTQLRATETMLEWAKRMPGKGSNPVVALRAYPKNSDLINARNEQSQESREREAATHASSRQDEPDDRCV
jgi:hypothetical protein